MAMQKQRKKCLTKVGEIKNLQKKSIMNVWDINGNLLSTFPRAGGVRASVFGGGAEKCEILEKGT